MSFGTVENQDWASSSGAAFGTIQPGDIKVSGQFLDEKYPENFMKCRGAILAIDKYEDLFDNIGFRFGTAYGNGFSFSGTTLSDDYVAVSPQKTGLILTSRTNNTNSTLTFLNFVNDRSYTIVNNNKPKTVSRVFCSKNKFFYVGYDIGNTTRLVIEEYSTDPVTSAPSPVATYYINNSLFSSSSYNVAAAYCECLISYNNNIYLCMRMNNSSDYPRNFFKIDSSGTATRIRASSGNSNVIQAILGKYMFWYTTLYTNVAFYDCELEQYNTYSNIRTKFPTLPSDSSGCAIYNLNMVNSPVEDIVPIFQNTDSSWNWIRGYLDQNGVYHQAYTSSVGSSYRNGGYFGIIHDNPRYYIYCNTQIDEGTGRNFDLFDENFKLINEKGIPDYYSSTSNSVISVNYGLTYENGRSIMIQDLTTNFLLPNIHSLAESTSNSYELSDLLYIRIK